MVLGVVAGAGSLERGYVVLDGSGCVAHRRRRRLRRVCGLRRRSEPQQLFLRRPLVVATGGCGGAGTRAEHRREVDVLLQVRVRRADRVLQRRRRDALPVQPRPRQRRHRVVLPQVVQQIVERVDLVPKPRLLKLRGGRSEVLTVATAPRLVAGQRRGRPRPDALRGHGREELLRLLLHRRPQPLHPPLLALYPRPQLVRGHVDVGVAPARHARQELQLRGGTGPLTLPAQQPEARNRVRIRQPPHLGGGSRPAAVGELRQQLFAGRTHARRQVAQAALQLSDAVVAEAEEQVRLRQHATASAAPAERVRRRHALQLRCVQRAHRRVVLAGQRLLALVREPLRRGRLLGCGRGEGGELRALPRQRLAAALEAVEGLPLLRGAGGETVHLQARVRVEPRFLHGRPQLRPRERGALGLQAPVARELLLRVHVGAAQLRDGGAQAGALARAQHGLGLGGRGALVADALEHVGQPSLLLHRRGGGRGGGCGVGEGGGGRMQLCAPVCVCSQ
eukprot:Rhum_TRINITY_DN13410_c0_g2::Rhum_TRINITY_DN13410_c0_g2_i1::g.59943::m.59943